MIKFINVRTGEEKIAETEPMISAYYNSSDQNINGIVQDFGWRLAPETVKEIRDIKRDKPQLVSIANELGMPQDAVKDTDILFWISRQDTVEEEERDYEKEQKLTREYEDKLRALEDEEVKKAPKKSTATQKSQKKDQEAELKAQGDAARKEFEAKEAAKKAAKNTKDATSTTSDSSVESEGGNSNY